MARFSDYGVNGTPYLYVDGTNRGYDYFAWDDYILDNTALTSPLGLNVGAGVYDYQTGDGSCQITLNPEVGASGDYTLYLVLIEDDLYYMGRNGYPEHEGVMRGMFPSSSGTAVTLEAGVEQTVNVNFNIPFYGERKLIPNNSSFVAFVQNSSDKVVLNAAEEPFLKLFPADIPMLTSDNLEITLIDDDGDHKLNPGESTHLSISLFNECHWFDAPNVTGYLSSSSPFVTVIDNVSDYGSVLSCNSTTNEGDLFSFSVSDQAPATASLDFSLRIVVDPGGVNAFETVVPITVTMDLFQYNFPVKLGDAVSPGSGNVSIDLDQDGQKEVIVGGKDSLLHVFTLDGTELAGFPFKLGHWVSGSPAVADIDNDGDLEIVVTSTDRNIYVIEHDGTGKSIGESTSTIMSTPALDDLDGDGDLEIVVPGISKNILVLHHDGTPFNNFPVTLEGEVMYAGASIADLNNDGSKDIVVGTYKGWLHAIDLQGVSLAGFPVYMSKGTRTAPVITDLDGDGDFEIIIGQDAGKVFAISHTGDTLWTRQVSEKRIRTSPAVCDFNENGFMEIVITGTDGGITILDYQGQDLPGWPQDLGGTCYSSPVIADLDGDKSAEIIVGANDSTLHAFHYDGTAFDVFPIAMGDKVQGTVSVDDLTQDGSMELIVGTDSDLSVVNLKAPFTRGLTWCTDRGNYQRTGFILNSPLSIGPRSLIPNKLEVSQNFPNPFNAATTIDFGIPENGYVAIAIYDALGQEIRQLLNASLSSGNYSILWNGLDESGRSVETGIYFTKITADNSSKVVKMILMK